MEVLIYARPVSFGPIRCGAVRVRSRRWPEGLSLLSGHLSDVATCSSLHGNLCVVTLRRCYPRCRKKSVDRSPRWYRWSMGKCAWYRWLARCAAKQGSQHVTRQVESPGCSRSGQLQRSIDRLVRYVVPDCRCVWLRVVVVDRKNSIQRCIDTSSNERRREHKRN